MTNGSNGSRDAIDPDPFIVGLGLFQILAAGGAFLEARRSRQAEERTERDRFSGIWFNARRSLIFFKRVTDEFETYMLEGGYGRREFRIGAIRLTLDRFQHQAMKRMHGQTMTTASRLADDIDQLSDFLGPEDQAQVTAITERLAEIGVLPERFRDVVSLSREAIELYSDLLDDIGDREGFETEPT